MCLPFHLYACSKPSLFWFQVIKINWTFNLISKPCPFLCLFKVGSGQLISKGEPKVFLHFPADPNLKSVLEGREQWPRDQQFSPLGKQCGLELCALFAHRNFPGAFKKSPCRDSTEANSIRIAEVGTSIFE